jgi:ATP-dependent Clp protease ATP-binding subunit ClpA
MSGGGIGFQHSEGKGKGRGSIERTFTPEFRNRLDAWIAFEQLSLAVIESVVDKFVGELNAQLREKNIEVTLTERAKIWFAHHGYDKQFGARPMERLIQNKIKEPLAEKLLFAEETIGRRITLDERDGELIWEYPDAPAESEREV